MSDGEDSESLFTEHEDDTPDHDLFADENGEPRLFYIHPNIPRSTRNTLRDQIEQYGGSVVDDPKGVDTILTAVGTPRIAMQHAYHGAPEEEYRRVRVEFASWIQDCIKKNTFQHTTFNRKAMPGIYPGTGRNKFTAEDDEKLCNWLARRQANYGEGGRSGLKIYEELIAAANAVPEVQGWALYHTPASFKERYKKNKARFDKRIEELCEDSVVVPGQLHIRTRYLNGLTKRKRTTKDVAGEEEEEEEESEVEEQEEEEAEEDDEPEHEHRPLRRPSERHSHPRRADNRRQSTRSAPTVSRKGKERAIDDNFDEPLEWQNQLEAADYEPEENPPTYRSIPTQDIPSAPLAQANMSSDALVPQIATLPPVGQVKPRPKRKPQVVQNVASTSSQQQPQAQASSSSPHRAVSQPPQAASSQRPPTQETNPPAPQVAESSQAPKRAARAPGNMLRRFPPPPAEAPYRNTRARSKTVEPPPNQAMHPPTKRQRRAPPAQPEPVQEEEPARQSSPYEDVFSAPMQETFAEEMDVANFLTTAVETQSVITRPSNPRFRSIETDDAHTRTHLFGGSTRPPLQSRNMPSAADLLRDFEEASEASIAPAKIAGSRTGRTSLATAQLKSRLVRTAVTSPPRISQPQFIEPPLPPSTPSRRDRGPVSDSDSSIASYPASGTRASALKKEIRRKEKMTPYKPPRGTQADRMRTA